MRKKNFLLLRSVAKYLLVIIKPTAATELSIISAGLTGRRLSSEHCKNISASKSGKNNPNYGKHRSEQTKAKLRLARLGEKNPQYGKPAPNRGKKHTEATKAKMRGKRHCKKL